MGQQDQRHQQKGDRRGLNATSIREVVRRTGTPWGSVGHHFPRGTLQLLEDALIFAGREVGQLLAVLVEAHGVKAGLSAFIAGWRQILEESAFEAGCPVLAVSVEAFVGEAGFPDAEVQAHLLDMTQVIFDQWRGTLTRGLEKEGMAPARARRLAMLIVASVEGTVALCRASRSTRALDDVGEELEALLAIAAAGAAD
ncbi:TetR/AcrR family transcriptional regulator [Zavarzinia compransoris]|uniref:TetR/AcrR family transcriptional regulator n=1 Tax=Zavarzinia compransoris TaxID=1264899 RepID=A0A317DUH5_9PROT|nr:TetR/AcrR family transcriptional regulator [Zavarzinia compransoris]PWR18338.1 TetR/AcrR family transcriptional regulator [Zavarzinia compransoris]TDP43602.1 TetR family transcriptional regulator [Zavarzinia compransoris]